MGETKLISRTGQTPSSCRKPSLGRTALASRPAVGHLPGNKKADELARLQAKGRRQDNRVTFQEKKTLIRSVLGQYTKRDDFHFLEQWQQVVVRRHGPQPTQCPHVQENEVAPSPICSCSLEDQTAERILQRCPLLQTARTNVWPTAVQLHTKQKTNWRRQLHSSCRLDSQCNGD